MGTFRPLLFVGRSPRSESSFTTSQDGNFHRAQSAFRSNAIYPAFSSWILSRWAVSRGDGGWGGESFIWDFDAQLDEVGFDGPCFRYPWLHRDLGRTSTTSNFWNESPELLIKALISATITPCHSCRSAVFSTSLSSCAKLAIANHRLEPSGIDRQPDRLPQSRSVHALHR